MKYEPSELDKALAEAVDAAVAFLAMPAAVVLVGLLIVLFIFVMGVV